MDEGDDIDLIIINNSLLHFHEEPLHVRDMSYLPLEPLCYIPAGFTALINAGNPFITYLLSEGPELLPLPRIPDLQSRMLIIRG